jgi:hypothetical protein
VDFDAILYADNGTEGNFDALFFIPWLQPLKMADVQNSEVAVIPSTFSVA